MKTLKVRSASGFTIIELMIALFITSLAIAGYIGANVLTQRNAEGLHERTVAIQDAHRVIEQMRNAARSGTFPTNVVTAYPNGGTVSGFTNLTNEQVQVSYASSTTDPLDATVTVTWTSYTNRSLTIAIRAYITQR